ncbi:hypothetical protein B9Z55_007957 [Caenorhabditis nigoni]|uniref:Uncharacterized protein n=1 Tax=Caenorhabditis nigoni TaxID=1611254 RepID=A0A2G5VBZ9_9PELO|nr:hypothetical protein B9Z55_007957 [Caenorhabditis nigoni]
MNCFLLSFILILFIPDVVLNDAKIKEEFVEKLNNLRGKFARNEGIPEMYKLVYNSSLEKFVASTPGKRSFSFPWLLNDKFFIRNLEGDVKKALMVGITEKNFRGYFETLVPLQKQIGCRRDANYQCYLVPETEFKLWTPSKDKSEAGSSCQNEYRNSDGLCAYIGLETTFADRLNNIRRTIANKRKVMEMFEVVPDSAISNLANPENLTKEVIEVARKMGFGFFKIPTYDVDEEDLKTKINEFLKMTDTEQKEDMEKSDGIRYGELISPSATFFGCRWDANQKVFQCLIGPVQTNYPWNSKPADPRKILGTDCPAGYKNKKGLCSPVKTDPNYFVHGVNMARRMAAKLFHIPAEREVIWKDTMQYFARDLENHTYDNISDIMGELGSRYSFCKDLDMFGQLTNFLIEWTKKSLSDKDEFLKKSFLEEMEFLNPNARDIVCVRHKESMKFLCIIRLISGKPKKFERFDNPKYDWSPGWRCDSTWNSEYSKDGLCVNVGYRSDLLEKVNLFRKDQANSHNITDMHELIWNDDLEEIAKAATWSDSKTPDTKSYRYVIFHSYHLIEQRLKSEMDALKNLGSSKREVLFKKIHGTSLGISEFAEPLQKFVGCSSKKQEIGNGLICVIGPREILQPCSLENRGVRIAGTKNKYLPFIPGTNCTSGYGNSDGLCTPKNASTLTLFGTQEDFIKDLNEYRRKVAKQFNVNAMFELYWSKDLDTMLSVLDWDAMKWPLAHVSFRYVRFRSYQSILDKIPEKFEELRKKSQKERRLSVYEKDESAGPVELLEPQQHLISCQVKRSKHLFENSHEFVVCLLGPIGQIEMWSMTDGFPINLAAFCGESYHFYQKTGLNQTFVPNDGLCSKTPDSKISYFGNARFFLEQANLVRKDRARRYALPKFMKLLWSPELVEAAKTLPYDSKSPPQLIYEPFRWMKLPHFLWHKDSIMEIFFDEITFKDKNLVKQWIYEQKSTSLGILELFGQDQEKIGCAKRNTSSEMFILCLLGPQSRFELIPLEKEYKRGLPKKEGRDCPSGTWSDGGLCTPDSEKPAPKKKRRRTTTTTTTTTGYSTTTTKTKKASDRPWAIIWNLLVSSIVFHLIFSL